MNADTERFSVTRHQLIAGVIVGVAGEHGPYVTQEQAERTADLIIRAAQRDETQPAANAQTATAS